MIPAAKKRPVHGGYPGGPPSVYGWAQRERFAAGVDRVPLIPVSADRHHERIRRNRQRWHLG
jgi:hypothetical protein